MALRNTVEIRVLAVASAQEHLCAVEGCEGIHVRVVEREPDAHDLAWADVVVVAADAPAAPLWARPILRLIPPDTRALAGGAAAECLLGIPGGPETLYGRDPRCGGRAHRARPSHRPRRSELRVRRPGDAHPA